MVWMLATFSAVHVLVIRLVNKTQSVFASKIDESQVLTDNLDEGVCILESTTLNVIYANKAADEFAVKMDKSFQMAVTQDDGRKFTLHDQHKVFAIVDKKIFK